MEKKDSRRTTMMINADDDLTQSIEQRKSIAVGCGCMTFNDTMIRRFLKLVESR